MTITRGMPVALGCAGLACVISAVAPAGGLDVETLRAVAALPAHIAGGFDISACQQSTTGDYFIFDRRAHAAQVVRQLARGLVGEIDPGLARRLLHGRPRGVGTEQVEAEGIVQARG